MRIGKALSNILALGYSQCLRCGTAWKFVKSRGVDYNATGSGIIAICEKCWDESDIRQRIYYYLEVNKSWFRAEKISLKEYEENKSYIIEEILKESE